MDTTIKTRAEEVVQQKLADNDPKREHLTADDVVKQMSDYLHSQIETLTAERGSTRTSEVEVSVVDEKITAFRDSLDHLVRLKAKIR